MMLGRESSTGDRDFGSKGIVFMKKRIIVALMMLVMLMAFTACEGRNAFIGHWRIVEITAGDITMSTEDMEDMGLNAGAVQLKKSGGAEIDLLGDVYDGTWEMSEDEQTATVTYGDDMTGTMTKTDDGMDFVDAQGTEYILSRF